MARPLPSPDAVAAKWKSRMQETSTAEAYRRGIASVQTNPMAQAATDAAQQKYKQATAKAVDSGRMAAALNRADFAAWKQASGTTGASHLSDGATKGAPKMQRAAQRLTSAWQAMQSAVAAVGPATPGNAKERWSKSYDALMQAVGKG